MTSVDSAPGPESAAAGVGFRESYFSELAGLEAGNFWFRARNELIASALRKHAPALRSLLEIGCGTGFVLERIRQEYPAADLVGSEIFAAGLEVAARRVPSATFRQLDAQDLPFSAEFDVIGAFDVIEHIDDDRAVLAEVARALRPGGLFVATVPQHDALWSQQDVYAHHVRRYNQRDLRRKTEAAGLEIVSSISFVSLLLPLMLVSRRRMKDDPEVDAIDGLRLSRPVNAVLGAVMTLERLLIRTGLSFPAGGSLLLVARKPAPEAAG